MKYLVTGLESSCTRIVSKSIALNLGIINDLNDWDGHEEVSDEANLVVHKSLPHGEYNRDNFIDHDYASVFDYIVICTRDWNCSLISKIKTHQPNIGLAKEEHEKGINYIKSIYSNNIKKSHVFSYETAYLMQDLYLINFMKNIGIENHIPILFTNVNEKYIMSILTERKES